MSLPFHIHRLLAVVVAAASVHGAAVAGSFPPAPAGDYRFTGSCVTGCFGTATGLLLGYDGTYPTSGTDANASSMTLSLALNSLNLGTSGLNLSAPLTQITFAGTLRAYLADDGQMPVYTATIVGANYQLDVWSTMSWTLKSLGNGLVVGGQNGNAGPAILATGMNGVLAPVPEPATVALMVGGLALVGAAARRRRNQDRAAA